jgi:two-component system, response regulator PdtaR
MMPARVMIVEDEVITAMATKAMLKRLGHEVLALVSSGEAALEAFRRQRPDLVFMDIRLEGEMDGIETARLLRRDADVPVVFLSAYTDDHTRCRAAATCPFAFLPKPLDEFDLHALMDRLQSDGTP